MCLLHVRIQEFSPSVGGGGRGSGPPDSKKLRQRCFVIFAVFLVLTFNLFNSFTQGSDGLFFGKQ